MRFAILLAGLVSLSVSAAAPPPKAELLPTFVLIPSPTENGWLTMECSGTPPYRTVECRFTQLSVSRKSDAEVDAEVAKATVDVATMTDEVRKKMKRECAKMQKPEALAERAAVEAFGSSARRRATSRSFQHLDAVCACPDDECLGTAFVAMVESQAKTCSISSNSFEMKLTRVGKRKWVNTPKPTGLCDAMTAVVIESQDDSGLIWTYTQTRISVDTEAELCKGMAASINKPLVYSNTSGGGSDALALDCSFIKASVF